MASRQMELKLTEPEAAEIWLLAFRAHARSKKIER